MFFSLHVDIEILSLNHFINKCVISYRWVCYKI